MQRVQAVGLLGDHVSRVRASGPPRAGQEVCELVVAPHNKELLLTRVGTSVLSLVSGQATQQNSNPLGIPQPAGAPPMSQQVGREGVVGGSRLPFPMSVGDVFGFALPGAVLLGGMYGLDIYLGRLYSAGSDESATAASGWTTPVASVLAELSNGGPTEGWVRYAALGVSIVLAVYVAGHFLSATGAFLVDRVIVFKGYGYPYERLLGLGVPTDGKEASRASYRVLFLFVNAYLVVRYLAYPYPDVLEPVVSGFGWVLILLFVFKAAPLGKTLRNPLESHDSVIYERFPRIERWRDCAALWWNHLAALLHRSRRSLWVWLAAPQDALMAPVSRVFHHIRMFDEPFLRSYRRCFYRTFGVHPDQARSHNYWYCWSYVLENTSAIRTRLLELRRLHRFARNLGTAFYALFVWIVIVHTPGPPIAPDDAGGRHSMILLPVGALSGAMVMLTWYYHLHFSTYSKYVFRSFVYLTSRRDA